MLSNNLHYYMALNKNEKLTDGFKPKKAKVTIKNLHSVLLI